MPAHSPPADAGARAALTGLQIAVCARAAAAGGVTRGDAVRDVAPFLAHRASPGQARQAIEAALDGLAASGLLSAHRHRFSATEAGIEALRRAAGRKAAFKDWSVTRDVVLVATALGLSGDGGPRSRGIAKRDVLHAAILRHAYGLSARDAASPAKLRSRLALLALQRAFGGGIATGEDADTALNSRMGRRLAGQLARRPRDFGTDGRLLAVLAAEAVGAPRPDVATLRLAILRRFVLPAPPENSAPAGAGEARARARHDEAPAPKPRRQPPAGQAEPAPRDTRRPAAASRPDLAGFAAIVLAAADATATGWPGNRKARIGDVCAAVCDAHPEWGLTEIEFKAMLAEAHRTGHVSLTYADIRSKADLEALRASAVAYKNTVLHFVRVEG